MRYFLQLAYKGSDYHGWQWQQNVISVQQVLEDGIQKMLHQKIRLHGCGRTDAGVHAHQYFAHFDIYNAIDFDFVFRLNKMLPDDIAVYDLHPVDDKANAQLDAKSRTYEYQIHFYKTPFLNEFSTLYLTEFPDLVKIKECLTLILNHQDFTNFCLTPEAHNHTLCDISEINLLYTQDQSRVKFRITANRFLRGMIRIMVGRLMDVGLGKISIDLFIRVLNEKEVFKFNKLAYPQGLSLVKVDYPYIQPKTPLINQDVWSIYAL